MAIFKGFGETNTIFHLDDPERYEREEGYRHYLAFFSDNNSCIRRDIFEKYPYEDVNFAEDQIWARKMIELGFKKVYCPYAPVYHSHNFKLRTYFKRYYDEQKGLYEVHQYMIAQKWTQLPGMLYRQVRGDCVYIRQQPLSKKEKIHWAFYSLFRNFDRFVGRLSRRKIPSVFQTETTVPGSSHFAAVRSETCIEERKKKREKTKCGIPCVTVSEESWIKRKRLSAQNRAMSRLYRRRTTSSDFTDLS